MKKQLPGTKFQSQKISRSITLLFMFFLIIRLATATNVCVNLSPVGFFSLGDTYTIDMNVDGMDDYVIRKGESGGLASIDIECLHSQSLVSYSVVGICPYAQALSSGDIIDK
jgi:hypothetical protein